MKNLTRTYLIALTIIALVIGFSQYLVQNSISEGSSDSRIINISGRQRMLSQKITKASLAMAAANNESEFVKRKNELQKAYDIWTQSHEALQSGSEELLMPVVNNPENILAFFDEIQPNYLSIKKSVESILTVNSLEDTQSELFDLSVQTILANEADFLRLMNDITFEYDSEATERTYELSKTEYILFAIAIMLLLLEGAFIFRPAIRKIQAYTKEILRQGKSLESALQKEEYLNNQAKSIFANVKQGVFLLDQDLMISEFYSKETEFIFDETSLKNMNFLKLLRSRLIKRDLEALEMFTEHLFNPEIREAVVNRLNPVEQVEIFPEKGDAENLDPRYIRISFARIMANEEIQQILVTVVDETDNVLMKKQIEEAEEKNKIESTQLLAILKVDPESLNDFLSDSIDSLNSISEEYEAQQGKDFIELIDYTFNVIHNEKGNATIIGLVMIEKKLHELEDSLVELKNQPTIEGKDFLKIIYVVSETIAILKNMQEMQARIASVYNQPAAKLAPEKNSLLIAKLDAGLKKMSTSNSKLVKLDFVDNGIDISSDYHKSIKDISIQLMRNSIVHGIESPEERIAQGKPATATIQIFMSQNQDNELQLDYCDDGKGLDVKKIVTKAISEKLIDKEELKNITTKDITDLVFQTNFSTSSEVNKYAGRGQGLGLVKSIIDDHQGSFKLGYKKNQFFKMRIVLPQKEQFQLLEKSA